MAPLREAQHVELFHLAFLQVLQARLDQSSYVLKGGTNLRYFFESVRYSEDIDLDAEGIEVWALADKVDAILSSPVLETLLRRADLAVAEFTKPKQTETTQRWKVALAAGGRHDPLRTKIEFSRRNGEERYCLEAVPGRIVAPYALRPPTAMHYTADAAADQKAEALADRSETQARDVFDLDLLCRRQPPPVMTVGSETLERAADRALELPFDALRDQVLPFLDPEVAELHADEAVWEQMQHFVVERLLAAR